MPTPKWSNFRISFTSAIAIISIIVGGSFAFADVKNMAGDNDRRLIKVEDNIMQVEKERQAERLELAKEVTAMASDIRYLRERIDLLLRGPWPTGKGQ